MNTFIIRLSDHSQSSILAQRCWDSCQEHGIEAGFWSAIDGTRGDQLIFPPDLAYPNIINLLVIKNELLSRPVVAVFLTHLQLWCHCVTLDKPITILEHDAVVMRPIPDHPWSNCIHYLGHSDQLPNNLAVPPYFTGLRRPDGLREHRYRFMAGAHAYSIDPDIARRLIADAIARGLDRPLDMFIEVDRYAVIQTGVYAINVDGDSSTVRYHGDSMAQEKMRYDS